MIMEMVSNHCFTLTTGKSKRSRLRHLKNDIPRGSVLAPILFNIYISDLTCQPLSSKSMHMLTILQSCMLMETGRQWRGAEQGHGNCRWIPPDLEAIIQHFFFTFFPFFAFAMQLFSTPVTSSNLRNQALLFTELCLLQGTQQNKYMMKDRKTKT